MRNQHVQVCFMADFNKTMKNHLDALKNQFDDILTDVQNQYPTSVIEVAFVGYTGVGDIPSTIYEPFTLNRKPLQRRMQYGDVSRGFTCDCRMVVEGYVMAGNLEWRAPRKIVFHMGNAPSHGANYHDRKLQDSYKNGHPYWTLEDQIKKLAVNDIDVVILKLSKTTTQMEKVLDKNYHEVRENGFYVEDLTNSLNNLENEVYTIVKSHMLRMLV